MAHATRGLLASSHIKFLNPRQNVATRVAQLDAPAEATTLDMTKSGLRFLPDAARARALDKKANKFEKVKVEKCGSHMWTEVHELAAALRDGNMTWEELNLDDVDVRLKWSGLFHRAKRTPKRFMMRLRVPNGELNSSQLRYLGTCIRPYGDDGSADISTRATIQLRGLQLEHADRVIQGLRERSLTCFQSGMDNVRNLTGNPIAGVDPCELVDTRPILQELQDMITNNGNGRADLTNLPRKINVCVSSTRDDFPHAFINDVGYEAVRDPSSGDVLFNLIVGGYFSIKRNIVSRPSGIALTRAQLVPFTEALLKAFRDHGARADRQQARLIWLIESLGMERWIELVASYMAPELATFRPAIEEHHADVWERRNLLGVHPQKQAGLNWVGACVPAGRLKANDFDEMAAIAEKYGDGTVRLTCEENVVFVNVPDAKVAEMLDEPLFKRFSISPGNLMRGMVSCTGSMFCGFGLAETKGNAVQLVEQLEAELNIPQPVRMHVTGCPNSCGQAQVGDIGLMGAPAKLNGKAAEGFKLFKGGKIGEHPELAKQFGQGVAIPHLKDALRELLISDFGATPKTA